MDTARREQGCLEMSQKRFLKEKTKPPRDIWSGGPRAGAGGSRRPLRTRCKASVGGMGKGEGSKEPDPGAARLGGGGEAKSQKAQPARRRAAAG